MKDAVVATKHGDHLPSQRAVVIAVELDMAVHVVDKALQVRGSFPLHFFYQCTEHVRDDILTAKEESRSDTVRLARKSNFQTVAYELSDTLWKVCLVKGALPPGALLQL